MNNFLTNFIILITVSIFLISCNNNQRESKTKNQKPIEMPGKKVAKDNTTGYGENVTMENAADATRIPSMLQNENEKQVKVIGKIEKVCQMEGCWLDIDLGNGETMHVTFKDESFVVPKDIAGKIVLMNGVVSKETIPVEMARKIARDEGKSESEINSIVTPQVEFSYEATGLVIR